MTDNVVKRIVEDSTEKLSTHEELQRSYQILSKLINNIDISNSEWITELFEELNDPVKSNLMSKISNNDEPTELIGTLSTMQKDDIEFQPELDDQFFDPAQLQKDLLSVVSLVETAKLKGNKRMDVLFAGFQALKQTQASIITKTINQYIVDTNLHKLDAKITEMEMLVTKLKSSLAEKRFVFNQRKADANLSAEDLRHKYETDVEDTIRGLVITIDRDKLELTRIEERQAQALINIDKMKAELSVLLHEIDREEKDRLVKDFNPVQFFYDINSITNSGQTDSDGTALITQQAVDESFRMLEAVSLDNTVVLDRIAAAEEEAKARRSELGAVLKREDNKALERLKKMTVGLESKIDNDRKRIALLELIVRQIDLDALNKPHETAQDSFGGHHSSQVKNVVRVTQHVGVTQSNKNQLSGLLGEEDTHSESAASAVHRSLYSKYKATAPVITPDASIAENDHSAYYSKSSILSESRLTSNMTIERPSDPSHQPQYHHEPTQGVINSREVEGNSSTYCPLSDHEELRSRSYHHEQTPVGQQSKNSTHYAPEGEIERGVRWAVNEESFARETPGGTASSGTDRPRDDSVGTTVSDSVVRQSRGPATTRRSYTTSNTSAANDVQIIKSSVSPGRQSVSPGRPGHSVSPSRGVLVSAAPVSSNVHTTPRRAIPTGQVNRMQQAIDMFDHERSRLLTATSRGPNDGFDYGDGPSSMGDARHILTYSMPVGTTFAPDSRLAESIAEQMVASGQIAPLSRSTLIMHNNNMIASSKQQPNSGTSVMVPTTTNKRTNARQTGLQQKVEQTDQDEALEGGDSVDLSVDATSIVHKGLPTRQSMMMRRKEQMPAREAFSADHFFKSSVVAESVVADKSVVEIVDKPPVSHVPVVLTSAPKGPATFRMFDANKAVLEGQESEASEYYMRTFGYQTALEQLNTLMNILTNYNSNHVSAVDGQVTFSRTAEEELESVEALRHQITSYVQRIKHAYHESHNVHTILKDIQSELSREAREIDLARSGLLRAIEGVTWPHYLKPGEYQSETEACKARIRELRQEARSWESKVNKKRRANMRLSTLLTSDQGVGGDSNGRTQVGKSQPSQYHQKSNQSQKHDQKSMNQSIQHSLPQLSKLQKELPLQHNQQKPMNQISGSHSNHSSAASAAAASVTFTDKQRNGDSDRTDRRRSPRPESLHREKSDASSTVHTSSTNTAPHQSAAKNEIERHGKPSPSSESKPSSVVHSAKSKDKSSLTSGSTPSAPRRGEPSVNPHLPVTGSPSRALRPGRQQRAQGHEEVPRDILRHPVHHTAESDLPSSGRYSVSNNRLAIFNDITDIYDNTLKAFRAASVNHEPVNTVEEVPSSSHPSVIGALSLGGVIGDNSMDEQVAVSTVDGGGEQDERDVRQSPVSSHGPDQTETSNHQAEEKEEDDDDEDEEDEDEESVMLGPHLVHFVPPELLLRRECDVL